MSRLPQRFYAVQTQTIDPEEIIQLVREMTELHDDGSEVHWCTSIGVLMNMYNKDDDRVLCTSERIR